MTLTAAKNNTNTDMRLRKGLALIASRKSGLAAPSHKAENTVAENVAAPKCLEKYKSQNHGILAL